METVGGEARWAVGVDVLDAISSRVLWLAVRMIHEANSVRPNPDGLKVGGHPGSSASAACHPDGPLLPLASAR
jgi:pyruvate dehydrogenase E1 component